MLESGVDGMKGISVSYNNLLIRFLQHESNTELFGLFKLWPRRYYRHMLPEDSCSLFWAVVFHALRLLPPILKASAALFVAGYLIISAIAVLILALTSGLPNKPDFFLCGGVLVLMVAAGLGLIGILSLLVIGGIDLNDYLTKKYTAYKERKRGSVKEKPLVVGTLALARKLYWSIKNRTCFKIEYVKEGEK